MAAFRMMSAQQMAQARLVSGLWRYNAAVELSPEEVERVVDELHARLMLPQYVCSADSTFECGECTATP
jgi:hypothetical protein